MKKSFSLILAGLLVGAAPTLSWADCSPACGDGYVCSVRSQGPPTVYGCTKELVDYVRKSPKVREGGALNPGGAGAVKSPAGGAASSGLINAVEFPTVKSPPGGTVSAGTGAAAPTAARTSGPKRNAEANAKPQPKDDAGTPRKTQ